MYAKLNILVCIAIKRWERSVVLLIVEACKHNIIHEFQLSLIVNNFSGVPVWDVNLFYVILSLIEKTHNDISPDNRK